MSLNDKTYYAQGLGLVLFAMIAVAGIVHVAFSELDRRVQHTELRHTEILDRLNHIRRIEDTYQLCLTRIPSRVIEGSLTWKQGRRAVEETAAKSGQLWAALERSALNDSERRWLVEIRDERNVADMATHNLVSILEGGNRPALENFIQDSFKTTRSISDQLDSLSSIQRIEAQRLFQHQRSNTRHAQIITVVAISITVLVLVVFALFMARRNGSRSEALINPAHAQDSPPEGLHVLKGVLSAPAKKHAASVKSPIAKFQSPELVASETARRLRHIADSVPTMLTELRMMPDGEISLDFVNERLSGLIGISESEAKENPYNIVSGVLPEDQKRLLEGIDSVLTNKTEWNVTFRLRHAVTGELRWINAVSQPFLSKDGSCTWYGCWTDISKIKLLEEKLENASRVAETSRQRILEITDSTPGFIFEYFRDSQGRQSAPFVSKGIEQIVGITCEAASKNVLSYLNTVLEEDRDAYASAIDASARDMEDFSHTFRIHHQQSGDIRWLFVRAHAPQRVDGGFLWRGYITDITAEKMLQSKLQEAHQLATSAHERVRETTNNVPGLVFEYRIRPDGSQELPFVSERIRAIMGLAPDSVIRDIDLHFRLVHAEDRAGYLAAIESSAAQKTALHHTFRIHHQITGQVRWLTVRTNKPSVVDGSCLWRGYIADVTEERQMQSDLHIALTRSEMAQRAGRVGIVDLDLVNGKNFWSDVLLEMYGIQRQDFDGSMAAWEKLIHEDDRERVLKDWTNAQANGLERLVFEYRIARPNNTARWLRSDVTFLYDAAKNPIRCIGVNIDISEEKSREDALSEAHEWVVNITDSVPGFVLEWEKYDNGKSRYTFVGRGIESLMGAPRDWFLEKPDRFFKQFVEEDLGHYMECLDQSLQKGGEFRHAFRIRRCDNQEVRWLETHTLAPSRESDHLIWRGHVIDITEQKALEAELASAREEAEAAARIKGDFLANMSHEIRTPLNGILGLTQLALKSELPARERGYLSKIHSSGKLLLGIINDILDFSKIEAGKMRLERVEISLEDVLTTISSMISPEAAKKGIAFRIEISDEIPASLIGDPLRLSQILINLVSNAVKFTERGAVNVRVEPRARTAREIELLFSVHDTGIGMSQEQQVRLFSSFSQADSSTTRKYGGTGLGLAICKQLVELMDGEIDADSSLGEGSTFWFTTHFEIPWLASVSGLPAAQALQSLKGIILEEDPFGSERICDELESVGIECWPAKSWGNVLDLLQHASVGFDVLIVGKITRNPGDSRGMEIIRESARELAPGLIVMPLNEILPEPRDTKSPNSLDARIDPIALFDAIRAAKAADPVRGSMIWPSKTLMGLNVLLVEDNDINQEIATKMLEEAGINVLTANNGEQALQLLANDLDGAIELILMDMQMPIMDGLEATRLIRADAPHSKLPIIAMTANAMAEDRDRCLTAGMNDHLAKPINASELFSTLARWSGRRTVSERTPSFASQLPANLDFADLPGVDQQNATKRLGNSPAKLRQALLRFRDSQAGAVDRLVSAMERGQREKAMLEAHTLRGLASTLGADALASQVRALESSLKSGAPNWQTLARSAQVTLEALIDALGSLADQPASSPTLIHEDISSNELQSLFDTFVAQIEDNDTAAIKTLTRLERALSAPKTRRALAEIGLAVSEYKYDEALEKLPLLRDALAGDHLG